MIVPCTCGVPHFGVFVVFLLLLIPKISTLRSSNLAEGFDSLHLVIVADYAFVAERADAFEMFGSGTPGGSGLPWTASEAPVASLP